MGSNRLARFWSRISKRWKERTKRWARRLAIVTAASIFLGALTLGVLWWLFPFPFEKLESVPAASVVTDRDGEWLRVYRSEADEIRVPVRLDEVSHWLIEATIAVEDRNFHSHLGVDPLAVLRAASQNLTRWEIHSGASTLTMQLVRILENRPRTFRSKAVEAFYALQIDARLEKDDIAELYLNLAPYGGNLRGVEAAARRYFGKGARDLNLAEAAMIAGLPQSPSRLRPDRHYERALSRRQVVLDSMLREGYIDASQHQRASGERPRVRRHPWPLEAPHFSDIARRNAADRERVAGTIEARAQACIRGRVAERLAAMRSLDGLSSSALPSVAVVVIDIESSEVRALLGSPDFLDTARRGQVDATLARRSSGSTLKPFLYALAFDRGLASPTSYLPDVPTAFVAYVPENFDHRFHGPVTAADSLRLSYNIPAVRLQRRVGTQSYIDCLRRLGLETLNRGARHYGLTLCLGGGEVRLLDLTNAYAALARGGLYRLPRFVVSERASDVSERVFSESASRLVIEALSTREHLRRARGPRPGEAAKLAYKTGTSFGLRDAWAVAFSPSTVVGVWLGDPRGRASAELVGLDAAAPLALDIAEELSRGKPNEWIATGDIAEREVCAQSGYPPASACENRIMTATTPSTRRLPICRVHQSVRVDPVESVEVCRHCVGSRETLSRVVEEWPPEVEAWLASNGKRSARLPHDPSCVRNAKRGEGPRILTPADGARYRLLESAPFAQRLALSAAAASDAQRLYWFVDDELYRTSAPSEEIGWDLRPGRHRVRCVDEHGRGDSAVFVVDR